MFGLRVTQVRWLWRMATGARLCFFEPPVKRQLLTGGAWNITASCTGLHRALPPEERACYHEVSSRKTSPSEPLPWFPPPLYTHLASQVDT